MASSQGLSDLLKNVSSTTIIGSVVVGVVVAFLIGKFLLGGDKKDDSKEKKEKEKGKKRVVALDSSRYQRFALKEKKEITHNTRIFRFALHKEDDVLGLPIGKHMSFRAIIEDKEVLRPYTPISSDDEKGYFDLLIKVYPQGKMTQYMDHLKIGDNIEVKGPKGKFDYKPNMKGSIGMLAGGTGLTPMLQIINAVFKNPDDKTKISLIFGNVLEEDIILREQLEGLVEKHADRFSLYHVLNKPPEGWTQGVGFVSADMIKAHLPAPGSDTLILLCGPTPMNNAMLGHLQSLSYAESMYFVF